MHRLVALASLALPALVGCGADVGDDGAELGETARASRAAPVAAAAPAPSRESMMAACGFGGRTDDVVGLEGTYARRTAGATEEMSALVVEALGAPDTTGARTARYARSFEATCRASECRGDSGSLSLLPETAWSPVTMTLVPAGARSPLEGAQYFLLALRRDATSGAVGALCVSRVAPSSSDFRPMVFERASATIK